MTAKHSFVDDYPYLAYSSEPDAVAKIADAAVDTTQIKDGAVTAAKLATENNG